MILVQTKTPGYTFKESFLQHMNTCVIILGEKQKKY